MVKIGGTIPDYSLEAFHEYTIKSVKLSDYKGKWLVIVFYPGDFTFICPTELEELARNYDEIKEMNAEVLSVSTDTVYVHKAWHDESKAINKVDYPMVSDPTGELCRVFGTYIEREGVSLRGTFIIDPNSILKVIEINDNNIGRSVKEILRKLKAAKYVSEHQGEVCPVEWEPGKETLKPTLDLVGKI
jgi:peroxiredoxin (alkyl hydroperoxide reductase subunit C)